MSKNRGKKKLNRETWSLDYELIKWINAHFIAYKKLASKIIDLKYNKFEYENKNLTQIEIIDRIIEITNYFINENDYFDLKWDSGNLEKTMKYKNEMYDLLKEVHFAMWW